MKHINMEQFAGGELSEQLNREILAVAKNITDPYTDAKATRKITLTVTMKPNVQRDYVETSITTKSTLAPVTATETALLVSKDYGSGEVEIAEHNSGQIPGQMMVDEFEESEELNGQMSPDEVSKPRDLRVV